MRMRAGRIGRAAIAALLLASVVRAQAAPADDAAIRAVQAQQEAAWNAHDAHAYASLLADDADLVTSDGWWWRSRAEAERKLAAGFAFVYAESVLHTDAVSVRPLADDLALAHVAWTMAGIRGADGSAAAPRHGIETAYLRRSDGRWLILSLQETGATPESPYSTQATPAGSATPAGTATPADAAPAVAPAASAAPGQAPARPCLVGTRDGKCVIYKGPPHRVK